jgi:hypothetical protein
MPQIAASTARLSMARLRSPCGEKFWFAMRHRRVVLCPRAIAILETDLARARSSCVAA